MFSKYDSFGKKEYESLFLHCKQNDIEFINSIPESNIFNTSDKGYFENNNFGYRPKVPANDDNGQRQEAHRRQHFGFFN